MPPVPQPTAAPRLSHSVVAADVVIVGAGVIGSAAAYELSRSRARKIIVFEEGTPGCRSSNAAAGVLAVASSQTLKGRKLALWRRSAAMFPNWVSALEGETGLDLSYRHGLVSVAFTDADLSLLQAQATLRARQGLSCEILTPRQILQLEPAVSREIEGGVLFHTDCSIDNTQLVEALVAAARQRGVEFRLRTQVDRLESAGNTVRVSTAAGVFEADTVVVAAGSWSRQLLARSGVRVPLRPAVGEMLAVATHPALTRAVTSAQIYLVPRPTELVIGSTTRLTGYEDRVTASGIAQLLTGALRLVPGLGGAHVLRWWSGVRPESTIGRPIVGEVPGFDRVVLATGHYRNGILLAPLTAMLVQGLIDKAPLDPAATAFAYRSR